MPGFPVHHQLPEFAQTHVHQVSDAIQPSRPLLPPSPFAFNLSQHQGLFQWVGSSHQVVIVLELQLQSFQWISGLISFKIDWFDLLNQGTLKSLFQYHSSKTSVLQCSAFFMIQLFYSFHINGIIKYVFCKYLLSLSRMFPGSWTRGMDQYFIFFSTK